MSKYKTNVHVDGFLIEFIYLFIKLFRYTYMPYIDLLDKNYYASIIYLMYYLMFLGAC